MRQQAIAANHAAQELVQTDGLGALVLFIDSAGLGNRDALGLLAQHIRSGTGQLPRSVVFADRIKSGTITMARADAELGDAEAANFVGSCLRQGRGIAQDRTAGLAWLSYAANLGDRDATSQLAAQFRDENPADARHWSTLGEAIQYGEQLTISPRRFPAEVIDLKPVLPQLEAAPVAATRHLASLPAQPATPADDEAAAKRYEAALNQFQTDRLGGLVALAQSAGDGYQYSAFTFPTIVNGGRFGPQPDLARRFHAVGIALLQIAAEKGDHTAAYRLGLYHLNLLERRDPVAAIRWLTYAAELGSGMAADYLSELYATGAPGIPVDPKAAARWTAFAMTTNGETFKPRAPLR